MTQDESLIYSVTVSIDAAAAPGWLEWMQNHHIPDVLATACFLSCRIVRVVDPIVDEHFETYNLQYDCHNAQLFERYQREFAPDLQADHVRRYEGRFTAFRTLLQPIGIWVGMLQN